MLVYFSPEITDEQKSGIARILREGMARDIEESGANVNAWTSGWSVETDIPVTQNSTDKSGIVFALCIGWPDEERRVAFRDKYDSQTGQLKINTLAEILAVENRVMKSKEFGVRQEDE